MREVLPKQTRRGATEIPLKCEGGQNALTLRATFGEVPGDVGFSILVEQRAGNFWSILGGADVPELARVLKTPDKGGAERDALVWTFYEQLCADPKDLATSRAYEFDGRRFEQLAICPELRLTVDSYTKNAKGERIDAELEWSVDVGTACVPLPETFAPLFGRA